MPVELRADVRALIREPGAYVSHESNPGSRPGWRDLYEVQGWEATGCQSGKLWVVNCRTEQRMWFGARDLEALRLEIPAPSLTCPDLPPASDG